MSRVLALSALLVLVCIPRFNMWDPGPLRAMTAAARTATEFGHPIDVEGYARLVRYLRGEVEAGALIAPFCHRPLGPGLAAALPAAPITAINLVNLASLIAALWLLDAITGLVAPGPRARWLAGLMFVVSFPAFYYGTIGFVDPVALATASLVLWLMLKGASMAVLVPALALAVLAKETNAALAVLPFGAALARGSVVRPGGARRVAILMAAGVGTFLLVQALMPTPGQDVRPLPKLAVAIDNLSRPRTYVTLMLTMAIPAALAVLAVRTGRARAVMPREGLAVLLTGATLAALLYAAAIFAAYTDGRMTWMAYPFVIPIAASYFPPSSSYAQVRGSRAPGFPNGPNVSKPFSGSRIAMISSRLLPAFICSPTKARSAVK
jgi:hypothetical protein